MGKLSDLATAKIPFFFITDFLGQKIEVYTQSELEDHNIFFDFNYHVQPHNLTLTTIPMCFQEYQKGFDKIIQAIKRGETYVLNFTQPTKLKTTHTLKKIYTKANARFKLFYKDQFVSFSPEPFITIVDNTISTFPMKGTIDASIPNAQNIILDDPKEHAEHTMVVDLLRNDLSLVATKVEVKKFRYVEKIQAGEKELLQISSQIQGTLPTNWKENLDTIITKLLPAGSISGAPKRSTVEHIQAIENYDRGFFSGVMGYFNGEKLTSSIMIRFIERTDAGLVYKSGGGITIDSDAKKEYDEMLAKIYIP
ncbi:MAG: aminodeoxychorismate synthase component I [Thiovulaceae bacterium]|nr:aminodeoxychorismate synthase component I [Sulfurimonadaceae bacterium]